MRRRFRWLDRVVRGKAARERPMIVRRLLIPVALAVSLAPGVIGGGAAALRGKLLPDLPQHLQVAEEGLKNGKFDEALAHLDLVLMDDEIHFRADYEGLPEAKQIECVAALRDAVALWSRALDRGVQFVEVGPTEAAEIVIVFREDVKQNGAGVAGFVSWRRRIDAGATTPRGIVTAEIKIRTVQPNGEPMSIEHMRHTAAHELGHVLGLDDSPYYGDVMGPLDLRNPVTGFEATELENLRVIRAKAVEMRKLALASQP